MIKKVALPLCFAWIPIVASAQQLANAKALFANGQVIISYDLLGVDDPNQKFDIKVYASNDGFANPLSAASGDVGENVAGGSGKIIRWDAAKALGTFHGEITFKVRAEMVPIPYVFNNPAQGASLHLGKESLVQWAGGISGKDIKLELWQGSTRIATLPVTKNTGQYAWRVSKDLSKGSGYFLRLTDDQQTVSSAPFALKPKTPLLLIASPLLVGAAVIPFVGGGDKGPITPGETHTPLAAAPEPN